MDQEGHRVQLPKLASGGANWVVYCNRIIWALQASSIEDHLQADAPPDAYITLGNLDSLTPQACWTKEEHAIKSALSQTLPDTAFLKVKGAANIKAAWDILKGLYEGRSKALVADVIR
jgi:hypothetical protein